MSARSKGSVRRLNSLGTRRATNGSAQIRSVPWARCSMNNDLPVVKAQGQHVAVVGEVHEPRPGARVDLTGQIRQQVVAVDVHLERPVTDGVPGLELVDDVGLTGGGPEGGTRGG